MVKYWNVFLLALTGMLREALVLPGPYLASSVAGSIIAYAMSLSSQWSVFGIGIGVAVACSLASMEILSIRTLVKLWRVKTKAFYFALILSIFALMIEWLILAMADASLSWMLRIVGIAFCALPGVMYMLQELGQWTDERIDSTKEREQVEFNLEIERKQREQEIELQKKAAAARWEVEQERIKLENSQEKSLAKIKAKSERAGLLDSSPIRASNRAKTSKLERAIEYLSEHPEATERELASAIGCSPSTAHGYFVRIRS